MSPQENLTVIAACCFVGGGFYTLLVFWLGWLAGQKKNQNITVSGHCPSVHIHRPEGEAARE